MHLSPLMFKDQMQQDVIMVLKFPSNSPVTHVAANTLPHLTIPAVVTVTWMLPYCFGTGVGGTISLVTTPITVSMQCF
ncbi:hypothetical protein GOODEAATRI_001820 [Goodea atripinnis]|uniref:Uncharacterized protein n=1 Tax=Goodea atripinnis TaxID=208336 RepID=A0ABV0PUH0_9TELE